MKKLNEKKLVSIIAMTICLVFCVISTYGIFRKGITKLFAEETEKIKIDYQTLYPFDNGHKEILSSKKNSDTYVEQKINAIKNVITNYYKDDFLLLDELFYIFGIFNKITAKNTICDDEGYVFALNNGYLSYARNDYNLEEYFNELLEFKTFLNEKDIKLMYIMEASSSDERLNQIPIEFAYFFEYGKMSIELENLLIKNDTNYIDTFSILTNQSNDYYDYFYKTDHHWNVRAGLLVANEIAKKLNNDYAFNLDLNNLDINNYTSVVEKNSFLGSCGKKVTHGYATELDDFEILIPKFNTNFIIKIDSLGVNKTDKFENALLNSQSETNMYKLNQYDTFLYGSAPLIQIENCICKNNLKILVIKDSKANVVTPYLATSVKYLDIIDLRYFNGSIQTYVNSTNPDVVMFLKDPVIQNLN